MARVWNVGERIPGREVRPGTTGLREGGNETGMDGWSEVVFTMPIGVGCVLCCSISRYTVDFGMDGLAMQWGGHFLGLRFGIDGAI